MDKRKKNIFIAGLLLFALIDIAILILINNNLPNLIDSDMSAEMILSKILLEEKSLISKSWYYSSEIRVFYIQLLYTFFFNFTNNWHVVRMLTIVVLHIILLFSTMYMCKQMDIEEYGPYVAAAILLAFNYSYFNIMVCAACYTPFIAVSFLTIGMMFAYGKNKRNNKLLIIIGTVLAVLAGLNGIRQIVITYLPLLLALFAYGFFYTYNNGFDKYKNTNYFKYLVFTLICTAGNILGYLINSKILAKNYFFSSWNNLSFTQMNTDIMGKMITDLLQTLGYNDEAIHLSTLISNVICAFIVIMLIGSLIEGFKKKASDEHKITSLFFVCNLFIFFLIYVFTSMTYVRRYNFPILVFTFPLIALGIHNADYGKLPLSFKRIFAVVFVLCVILRSGIFYRSLIDYKQNADLISISKFLVENDYKSGYATYWNADVITELSNGEIAMRSWSNSGDFGVFFEDTEDPNDLIKWLQPVSFVENEPEGKIFTIYKTNEIPYCNWQDHLRDEDIIFKTDSRIVYGYDNYKEMMNIYMGDNAVN